MQELDEDVEGLQSTIFFLQQELKTAKETISVMEKEKSNLRLTNNPLEGAIDTEEVKEIKVSAIPATNDEFEVNHLKKRSYNSDSSDENSMDTAKNIKKTRRSSVLSLDLNEEDDIENEDNEKKCT